MCFSPCHEAAEADEAARINEEIERQLRRDKIEQESIVKMLLLGAGDSGKSTVLKQMRIIHKVGFSAEEVETFRQRIYKNIINGMRLILEALLYMDLTLQECNMEYPPVIESAPDLNEGEPFPQRYHAPLQCLWDDGSVQAAVLRGNEVALPDNLRYFFDQLDRFFEPSYRPTDQDIVRCRVRTTGITETVFRLKAHTLHLFDVGGQRSERRKWIHCFQDVTAILFLVSLNGFDMCLTEDRHANQMMDAMAIWDSICHSAWFKATPLVLFLNKLDLFAEKVQYSNIKSIFEDFDGGERDVTEGREYFKRRFLRLSQNASRTREREVYVHFTTSTDTALLRVVMSSVEDSILRQQLFFAAML